MKSWTVGQCEANQPEQSIWGLRHFSSTTIIISVSPVVWFICLIDWFFFTMTIKDSQSRELGLSLKPLKSNLRIVMKLLLRKLSSNRAYTAVRASTVTELVVSAPSLWNTHTQVHTYNLHFLPHLSTCVHSLWYYFLDGSVHAASFILCSTVKLDLLCVGINAELCGNTTGVELHS